MSVLNEKQRLFARLVFEGKVSNGEAYRRAFGDGVSVKSSHTLASRLLKKVEVQEFLKGLHAKVEDGLIMNRQERLEWLSRVVRTPVGEVDEGSDLAQEFEQRDSGFKVKMPSKLAALQELNRLDGAYVPERSEVSVSVVGKVLDRLGSQGLFDNL